MREPEVVRKVISNLDGDFSKNSMEDEDIEYIQYSYLNLSKYIYLPFLYGYNINSVKNCPIYFKAKKHLKKVRLKEIDTVSDIHEIVGAVFKLTESMDTSKTPDSVYLNKLVDEYVLLSQAATDKMISRK